MQVGEEILLTENEHYKASLKRYGVFVYIFKTCDKSISEEKEVLLTDDEIKKIFDIVHEGEKKAC